MAIPRKHKMGGSISAPGEYRVTVEKMEEGISKKSQKRMLTVFFVTRDEKRIKGFYVAGLKWHMDALADLKIACGLTAADVAGKLIGKELGIAVGEQEPNAEGRVFMQIEGYGKATEVGGSGMTESDFASPLPDDGVPF